MSQDQSQQPQQSASPNGGAPNLNANARPFSFNANSSSFVPNFQPQQGGGQGYYNQNQNQGYYNQHQNQGYYNQHQNQGYYNQNQHGGNYQNRNYQNRNYQNQNNASNQVAADQQTNNGEQSQQPQQNNYQNRQGGYQNRNYNQNYNNYNQDRQQGGYQNRNYNQNYNQDRQQGGYQNRNYNQNYNQDRQNNQNQSNTQQSNQAQDNKTPTNASTQQAKPAATTPAKAAAKPAAKPQPVVNANGEAPVLVFSSKPAAKPAAAATEKKEGDAPVVVFSSKPAAEKKTEDKPAAAVEKKAEEKPVVEAVASPKKADNWEEHADKKEEAAAAPAPAAAVAAAAAEAPKEVEAVSKKVEELKLDPEEAKELAEAEAAERASLIAKTVSYAEKKSHDEREHINIVFIGHVDAGKSTISGQILLQTGQVDERTIAKYEKEAKEKNRESWYLAYILDTNEEERAKGKTVEVGRAHFTTAKKRYTLLDAPGHKNYVPNMIGGASQADVGVLVISAKKGEFESGFDKGGQTREHAMLAKTLGLQRLIVLVNKMDEPTVKWEQERFDEIEGKLTPYLKKCGFNMKTDVFYVPASGYTGANIKDPVPESVCPWVKDRRSLFQILDDMPPLARDATAGLRLPIMARYKDMGALFVIGKLESGTLVKDTKLLMMPNNKEVQCIGISVDEQEVDCAKPGENVVVKLKGIEEEEVQDGFVLSYTDRPCKRSRILEGQIAVLDLLEHRPLITAGYQCILHVHVLAVECELKSLMFEIDKKTGDKMPNKPKFLRNGAFAHVKIVMEQTIACERFSDFQPLGRFTLRDEGKTIAIGKIINMKEEP